MKYRGLKIAAMFLALVAMGQSADAMEAPVDSTTMAAIDRINNIKLDAANYIYAESTMADWKEAYDNAKVLLKEKIELWLKSQDVEEVVTYVAKSDEKFLEIKAQRGNKYRAFVYVKKSDIMTFSESRQVITNVPPKKALDAEEEDSPVVTIQLELPQKQESQEKKEEIEEDTVPAEAEDSIAVEVEDSVAAEVVEETAPAEIVAESSEDVDSDPIAKAMVEVTEFDEVQSFIMDRKANGTVAKYGKYATRPTEGRFYMFVYNKEGKIPACLLSDNGTLTNLKTGQKDSMDNYKNCGAIWFK